LELPATQLPSSWARILIAALGLFVLFLYSEHEFRFAGQSIAVQDEEVALDRQTDAALEGSQSRRIAVLGFAAVGMTLLVLGRGKAFNPHRFGLAVFALLLAWACLSVGWSLYPSISLRRLIAWLCFVIGCVGVARTLTIDEILRVALLSLCAMIVMSFAADLAVGAGPWRADYRFSGTLHPNVQASYCAALCLAAYCLIGQRYFNTLAKLLLVAGGVMIFLTGSRTSLLATIAALTAVWLLRQRSIVRVVMMATAASAVGVVIAAFFALSPSDQHSLTGKALLGRTEKADTLSGRIPLWDELLHYAADRPLHGYGYDAFWTPGNMEDILETQEWTMTSAHNVFLEVTLQIGLVGLSLALVAAFVAVRSSKRCFMATENTGYQFVYGLLIYALLNGLLEAHFVRPKFPTALVLMGLASVILFRPTEKELAMADELDVYDRQTMAVKEALA